MMSLFSYFQNIYWREPLWLLLALQPLIISLLRSILIKNNISLYAEKKLQPWVIFPTDYTFSRKIFSKNSAYLLAWLLFSISLAGPRTPLTQVGQSQFYGANIMLVVDLSRSMQATDIKPNRLRRAKVEIDEFLEKAKGHRVGISVFSARPHILVPLTSDHSILQTYIESIDKLSFPTLGSNPIDAIMLAQNELNNISGNSAIVLLTDGDFDKPADLEIEKLKSQKIPLYILGVGTPEGEAIPLKDGTWLKQGQQHIVSKMNEKSLKYLAAKLDGIYSPLHDDNGDWDILYNEGIAQLKSKANSPTEQKILWHESFSWFLVPSILLFIFSLSSLRLRLNNKTLSLYITCIISFFLTNDDVYAFGIMQNNEQTAYQEYMKGNYLIAEKHYTNIDSNRIYHGYFGQATSLYKMGHYQEAIQKFIFAALNANDDTQRIAALYNLANSYFRTGDFSSAIDTYQDVLRYNKNNQACLHNLNVSKVLKNNIEQRLKQEQEILSMSRQGNGPRASDIADGTEINENTSISMGDGENKLDKNIPLPDIPNINEDTVKKLILSGLKHIKLADQGDLSKRYSTSKNRKNINVIKAKQKLNAITDSQHLLWKRLFEIEEGFPAPVEEPRTIPGVNPW